MINISIEGWEVLFQREGTALEEPYEDQVSWDLERGGGRDEAGERGRGRTFVFL